MLFAREKLGVVKIHLAGLRFKACHGVDKQERSQPQPFLVDVDLDLSTELAAETDNLNDTVDYVKVYQLVKQVMEGSSRKLLEKLAGEIANRLLELDKVATVRLVVKKPKAPLQKAGEFDWLGVEVIKTKI